MGSTIFAGAANWSAADNADHRFGLFRMETGNGGWETLTEGLPDKVEIRHLAFAPSEPDTLYAGTHAGPYRSRDGGRSWEALTLPSENAVVWSLLLHPTDPNIIYAGTQEQGLFRSENAGASWTELALPDPAGLCKMDFASRVVRMTLDPANPEEIYVGIEVGGLVRSLDGGETFEDCCEDLLRLSRLDHLRSRIGSDTDAEGMMDTHAVTISPAHPGTVILATRMGLFRSDDKAETWRALDIGRYSDLTYARDVQVSPHDPGMLYAAFSAAAVSDAGSLYRSGNLGETWSRFDHDVSVDSTMMHIGQSAAAPERVICGARRGQVFATEDGGANWTEYSLPGGVQGVYAVACA